MLISDILEPACVKAPLDAANKRDAVFELVGLLAQHTPIDNADDLGDAVWERETTRTTGIGHGIGIPHGKTPGVDRLRMAFGKPAAPLEFGSIDGKPVDLIFLLASPVDQTGPHIQALARLSKMLVDADFRDHLRTADPADLARLITERDAALNG